MNTGNAFTPLVHKHLSYEAEKEVRLIILYTEKDRFNPNGVWDQYGPVRGYKLKIDLKKLISEVIMFPRATEEDRLRIEALLRAKGIECPVRHSVHSRLL